MQVADRSAHAVEVHAQIWAAFRQAPRAARPHVVLKPLSRPELGEITIEAAGFAIGRNEPPFSSYGTGIANMLSREHARIFHQDGGVYLADLNSRNGTTINRVKLGRAQGALRDGDEICIAGVLSYRVEITPRVRADAGLRLTLTPKSVDCGLDPIAIAKFPFVIGRTETMFSVHVNESAHGKELEFLSRRHAYIYQKEGQAYVEDLGSGNGTFVNGQRLTRAVPLHQGTVLAFGGTHFIYDVGITLPSVVEQTPGSTSAQKMEGREILEPQMDEGTQFTAAPNSFLRILCEADPSNDAVQAPGSAVTAAPTRQTALRQRPRGRIITLWSELASLIASDKSEGTSRRAWWIGAVAGTLGALAVTAVIWTAPERHFKDAMARSDYARAEILASRLLDQHPEDTELKARATETALKANVPAWLLKIQAHDFAGAKRVLSGMSNFGTRDADLAPLIDELAWLGTLETLISTRGGPDAPIRIYADEDSIEQLVERWNGDAGEHQRALARIASRVPQFGDWYGAALTQLRRLQSDSTVYLPVIERVKTTIATELERDNPDALDIVLQETAEKYPGLGGLDTVRQDLSDYLAIRREARTPQSGRLFALLEKSRFVTPAFQPSVRALRDSGQLPPVELVRQYDAATQAWKRSGSSESLAGLQEMAAGPWGEAAAAELARRRGVMARFAALQQSRNTSGFVDQLLAFRESVDAEEDGYFLRTTATDLNQLKSSVIARAQDALNRARTSWQEYRSNGAIDAAQRIQTAISDKFRTQARLLADASRYARQGFLLYSQVDAAGAARWAAIRHEIDSEVNQQRTKLHDLDNVVEPELLNSKLALLGEPIA